MRHLLSKAMTGTVLGAGLLLAACGSTEPAANNMSANVEELNAEDSMMNGTMNDSMTNMDGAMMNDMNMSNDANMMANDMMSNDMDTNLANGM